MPSTLTPVKVRGKRDAASQLNSNQEQWDLSVTLTPPKRPRASKQSRLSKLEQLPLELTEKIFIFSNNLDLPFVSHTLLKQLSSKHLQNVMIEKLLSNLLLSSHLHEDELHQTSSLLDRRCLTWSAFQQWLDRSVVDRTHHPSSYSHFKSSDEKLARQYAEHFRRANRDVQEVIPLPRRILRDPWTRDRLRFLYFWKEVHTYTGFRDEDHEVIRKALHTAVASGCVEAAFYISRLANVVDEDLFEQAVVTYGCDMDIIDDLLINFEGMFECNLYRSPGEAVLPYFNGLNPRIWSWTDEINQIENGKGSALKAKLKQYRENIDGLYEEARLARAGLI